MVWKLLRRNISAWQIAGYALACLVGLSIVLVSVKFYCDVSAALGFGSQGDEDNAMPADYLVISRPVNMLSTLGLSGHGDGIDADDIANLETQPWAREVGKFVSANFSVTGSVEFHGQGMWSQLFLEAVPDNFIDNMPDRWSFDSADPGAEVPILIPKDYLALYNHGFAPSRGLPQLSESLVSKVPISLYLNGNGHSDRYRARIVGFSSRLNTIAVPYQFMEWANNRYSSSSLPAPSRLIVKVSNPGDPDIEKYLKENDFELAGDRLNQSKYSYLLAVITTTVASVGLVICILSLFILMLSITLLMQKNKEKNAYMMLLGYSPSQIGARYFTLVGIINAIVLALAVCAMLAASQLWSSPLESMDIHGASPAVAMLVGVAIMAITTGVNYLGIWRSLRKSF